MTPKPFPTEKKNKSTSHATTVLIFRRYLYEAGWESLGRPLGPASKALLGL